MTGAKKKLNLLETVLIGLLFANLIYLIKIYNIPRQSSQIINLERFKSLTVLSSDGSAFLISEIIGGQEIYVLFFRLTDCPSCIHGGLEQAKTLINKGKNVIFITIHDWFEDWKSWLQNLGSNNFFHLK